MSNGVFSVRSGIVENLQAKLYLTQRAFRHGAILRSSVGPNQHYSTFTGFRFLRVLYLLSIPDVLQYLRILRSRTALRLSQLLCNVVCALLTSAGMFHLVRQFTTLNYGAAT